MLVNNYELPNLSLKIITDIYHIILVQMDNFSNEFAHHHMNILYLSYLLYYNCLGNYIFLLYIREEYVKSSHYIANQFWDQHPYILNFYI